MRGAAGLAGCQPLACGTAVEQLGPQTSSPKPNFAIECLQTKKTREYIHIWDARSGLEGPKLMLPIIHRRARFHEAASAQQR